MELPRYCSTGKKKLAGGDLCVECNGYHKEGVYDNPPLRISVRTIAHMLHDEEITPRDAAISLFLLTQESVIQEHHKHD